MANLVAGRRSSHLLVSASFAVIVLATAVPAQGQTWDGSDSSDPLNGANWVGGVAPTPGANIIITGPATHMPTINGAFITLGSVFVGHDANLGGARVDITNGSFLTTTSASVGEPSVNNAGNLLELDSGFATVSEASWWTSGTLSIGARGQGTVEVTGGSNLTVTASLNLGTHRDPNTLRSGTGTLTVSGANSTAISSGTTTVGDAGAGTIEVLAGGKLTTSATTLGRNALSAGQLTLSGTGSRWEVYTGTTVIGQSGIGEVTISGGATASTTALGGTGLVNLAVSTGSSGTLTVTGGGSRFEAGQLFAGQQSEATLSALAGGVINATQLRLGTAAAGTGKAFISGANSEIDASTHTMIGVQGRGEMTVSDGAILRTPILNVALLANSNGTLNIGAAAGSPALAPGTVAVPQLTFGAGNGALVFNHTGTAYTFAPVLTGTGTVRHLAGTTTLTGNSSALTGNTRVEGGLLRVNQTLTGAMTVLSGGALGGNGTVGVTQVDAGGAIAPDGTLNVAGNLTFANGSFYRVDAGGGTADLIAATGTVAINGGVVALQASTGHFDWREEHKILSANTALTGTFDSVTSQMAFLDPALDYSRPNEVWLNLKRNDTTFGSVGTTSNQQNVGQALSSLPDTHPLASAMLPLSGDQARDALDQLAGDTHSTLQGVNGALSNQVQDMVANRIRQSFNTVETDDAASSYLASSDVSGQERVPTFWLQGLGEHMRVDANGGAGGLSIGSAGLIGGADMLLLDDWRVGIAGGYARSSFSAIGRPASGTSDNLYAGIYAGAQLDAVRLQLSAQHVLHGLSTRRDVAFGGFTDTLTADYWAQTSQVHGELGYVLDLGAVEIEPFGSLSYAMTNSPAFTETGGVAALSSAAAHSDAAVTVLGTRLEAPFALEDMLVTVRGMVGWQYQHGQAATSQFTMAGSQPFAIAGASLAGHALVYEAGLNMDVTEGLNLDVVYAGRLSTHDVSHSIKGIVAARF